MEACGLSHKKDLSFLPMTWQLFKFALSSGIFTVSAALALTIGIDVVGLSSYPTHGTLKVT